VPSVDYPMPQAASFLWINDPDQYLQGGLCASATALLAEFAAAAAPPTRPPAA